jgi:hypothetical protein
VDNGDVNPDIDRLRATEENAKGMGKEPDGNHFSRQFREMDHLISWLFEPQMKV